MRWLLDPAVWNGIGVMSLLVMFQVAQLRGWIVLGPIHRAEVAQMEQTHTAVVSRMDARAANDARTIAFLLREKDPSPAEELIPIITSLRDAATIAAGDS